MPTSPALSQRLGHYFYTLGIKAKQSITCFILSHHVIHYSLASHMTFDSIMTCTAIPILAFFLIIILFTNVARVPRHRLLCSWTLIVTLCSVNWTLWIDSAYMCLTWSMTIKTKSPNKWYQQSSLIKKKNCLSIKDFHILNEGRGIFSTRVRGERV